MGQRELSRGVEPIRSLFSWKAAKGPMWEGVEMASQCPGRGEGERNYNYILKIINKIHVDSSATD